MSQRSHPASNVANVVTRPPADLVAVRDDLRALAGYHSAQVDVEVRLNTNESPFPPPEGWQSEVAAGLASIEWHRYPDRSAWALRSAIAHWHGVDPANVFAANGSNEVLQTLLLTYAGPGRSVLTFEPTYQLHAHIARITGADVVEVERAADFSLDIDVARAAVAAAQPAVTFLCSPNNPTGRVEDPAMVQALLDIAPGLVVVDEAYAQFADWSALDLVREDLPLVVVRTFSKTWSMAAARLGYLVAPAWLVGHLEDVVLPYHLDAAKQAAGRLALGHVDEMDARVKTIVAERERLVEGLRALPVEVFPSGANFVLIRVTPSGRSGGDVWQALVDRSVLVRDCSGWPRLDGCLRVTIGTPTENDRFLAALGDVLA
jgi:histidinol-phosphate aminotransferase